MSVTVTQVGNKVCISGSRRPIPQLFRELARGHVRICDHCGGSGNTLKQVGHEIFPGVCLPCGGVGRIPK